MDEFMSEVNKGGRPEKICPEIRNIIIEAIGRNVPYQMAAWAAKISEASLYNWLNWGAEDKGNKIDSEYSRLLEDIKKTEYEKVVKLLDSVENREKNWQASMTLLERRWREFFGQDAGIIQHLLKQFDELKAQLGDKK